jgi:hypothetical protein
MSYNLTHHNEGKSFIIIKIQITCEQVSSKNKFGKCARAGCYIQNHTNALTIYKKYTQLSLLKVSYTWFASSFIMLKRSREVKAALGSMVISEFWSFWRKTDQASSKKLKDTILDDDWWERVDITIKIMELIISLLQFAGTDKSILGEVYEGWESMIESMRTIIL